MNGDRMRDRQFDHLGPLHLDNLACHGTFDLQQPTRHFDDFAMDDTPIFERDNV